MTTGGMDDVYRVGLHLDTSTLRSEGEQAGRQAASGFQTGFGNVDLNKGSVGLGSLQEGATRASGSIQRLSREFLVLGSGLAGGRIGLQELSLIAVSLGHHLGEGGLSGATSKLGAVLKEVFTNPVTIAVASAGALGYALVALTTESSQTEIALARQKKVLDDLKEGYGAAATKALEFSKIPGEAKSVDVAAAETNVAQLQENLQTRMERMRGLLQAFTMGAAGAGPVSGTPFGNALEQITAALDKFDKAPKKGLQEVMDFRESLGKVEQSIPVGDPLRREIEMFTEADDAAKALGQSLNEQLVAQEKLAEGIDPVTTAYKALRDAAADAKDAVDEAHRSVSAAQRGTADAAEKSREAEGRAAVTSRFGAAEQAIQDRQIRVLGPFGAALGVESAGMGLRRAQFEAGFAPEKAAETKEGADLDLQEFQLTYGQQQRRIMRGPRLTRGIELQRLELRRHALERQDKEAGFSEAEQPEATSIGLRQAGLGVAEAEQRRRQAGIEAGKAVTFEGLGLSPTGAAGPGEAAAKARRDAEAAADAVAKAGADVAKALRGVGQAIDKEREASFGLKSFERFHPDVDKAGAPPSSAGTGGQGDVASKAKDAADALGGTESKSKDLGSSFDELRSKIDSIGKEGGAYGKGNAGGGLIHGPGTDTSDSIPARLSAGEYVVRASSVRNVGLPFLEALNHGYARGGRVTLSGLPSRGNVPEAAGTSPGLWEATAALRAAAAGGGDIMSALGAVGAAAVPNFGIPVMGFGGIGREGQAAQNEAQWSRIGPGLLQNVDRLGGTQGLKDGGGEGMHQLDLRTNAGTFTTHADAATIEAMRASALGEQLYSTGTRPSWFS